MHVPKGGKIMEFLFFCNSEKLTPYTVQKSNFVTLSNPIVVKMVQLPLQKFFKIHTNWESDRVTDRVR